MIAVAYFTPAGRKIMAGMQRRRGPNAVGVMGPLQTLGDGLKLFAKEKPFFLQLQMLCFSY